MGARRKKPRGKEKESESRLLFCCAPKAPGARHTSERKPELGRGRKPAPVHPCGRPLSPELGRNGRGAWRGLATGRPCYLPRPLAPVVARQTMGGPCSGIRPPWGNKGHNKGHVTSEGPSLGIDFLTVSYTHLTLPTILLV